MKSNDPLLGTILAEYRRQIELQGEQELQAIAEYYGLSDNLSVQNKQEYIDVLVEHYRKELEMQR